MKKVLLTTLLLSVLIFSSNAQIKSNSDLKYHDIVNIDAAPINGYIVHLPPDYYSNPNKKYPMLVFLHGKGEKGDGSSQIFRAAKLGPSKEVERNGSLCVTVDGKEECFIVISPQTSQGWGSNVQKPFWEYILDGPENYRYDPERIFLTGLSLGGNGVWRWAQSGDPLASRLSGIAPVCGWGNASTACDFAQEKVSVWGFHGTADNTVSYEWGTSVYESLIQCNNPGNKEWKWSPIEGKGHAIWNLVYTNDHANFNPNVYEWMVTQYKSQGTSGGTNNRPSVTISSVNAVTLPTNQVVFTANASDTDGWITNYTWTKVSGPSVSMANTSQSKMTASGLVAGTYEFRVTVTDDDGAKASATATLTVNPEPVANQAPTVSAGADKTVTEGSNVLIAGTANDPDGWITTYAWTKVSGPAVTLRDQDKLGLTVVTPAAGTYEFQLRITDNDGATAQDRMILTVNAETAPSGELVINAGDDFSVDVSAGTFSTVARWNDIPDAFVTGITWEKVSGPAVNITQGDKARLIADGINVGVYDFTVTVNDSKGRSGTDHVLITVTGEATTEPEPEPAPEPEPTPSGDFPVDAGLDFEWDASKGGFNILARWELPDAFVTGIQWEKVSGPSATLSQVNKAKLLVDNPSSGTYEFMVTVTDSKNRIGTDNVVVTVINGAQNDPGSTTSQVSVNAGDDFEWDASKGGFNILARWDIPDAYVTNILWRKISGPSAVLSQTDKAKLVVDSPNAGTYEFEVSITDSKGRSATDRVFVTVIAGSGIAVNAGNDFEWEASKGTFNILARWDIPDGFVTNISWTKTAGPWVRLSQTDKAKLIVETPAAGTYTFRVSITDNKNRSASDEITVVVTDGIVTTMSASDDITEELVEINDSVIRNYSTSGDYLSMMEDTGETLKIQLININGQMVQSSEFSGQLNTAVLQSGMYIYHVTDADGYLLQKGRIVKY